MTRDVPVRQAAEALKARYIEGAAPWHGLPVPASLRLGALGAPPGAAGTVVLVEGWSDLAAVEVLVGDTPPDGVAVVSMGGVTNVGHLVAALAAGTSAVVLCDEGEEAVVRAAAPGVGVLVCRRDLEDELIRAAGTTVVQEVLTGMGEDRGLATFRAQPSQQGVALADGLRRFMGTRSGRKIMAARRLTERLAHEDRLPPVLTGLVGRLPTVPPAAETT